MCATTIISKKALQAYSCGRGDYFDFDLSAIPAEEFPLIVASIRTYAKQSLKGIGFNTDTLQNFINTANPLPNGRYAYPDVIYHSAYHTREFHSLTKTIANIISAVLPRTTTLKQLRLSNLEFKEDELVVIVQSLAENKSIESVNIEGIPFAEHFSSIVEALCRPGFLVLKLNQCRLSDDIADSLKRLIAAHVFIKEHADKRAESINLPNPPPTSLLSIELRQNLFTNRFLHLIRRTIDESGINVLDLRGCPSLTEGSPSPKILLYEEPEQKEEITEDPEERLEKLQMENERLIERIRALTNNKHTASLDKGLWVVGDRVDELLAHLDELKKIDLDAKPPKIPKIKLKSKRTTKKKTKKGTKSVSRTPDTSRRPPKGSQ